MNALYTTTGNNLFGGSSNFSRPLNGTVDQLLSVANGALCISSFAIQQLLNPASLLTNAKDFILGIVQNQVKVLSNLFGLFVANKLQSIGAMVTSVVSILGEGIILLGVVNNILHSLDIRSTDLINSHYNKENCAAMMAQLARCMQGQVNNILTNKLVKAFGLPGVDQNNQLALAAQNNFFTNTNILEGYANKMAAGVNRSVLQLTTVNNQQSFTVGRQPFNYMYAGL